MKNFWLILLFGIIIRQASTAQTTWFVNQNATGANSGLDWPNAFTDLHLALAAAQAGDAIWVARGQYVPTGGANRNARFELKSGVKLYGSFAGTETQPAQRNREANPTTLSGDIGVPGDSTDNAFTILYLAYPDSSTRIDGFTFRHGLAASDTSFNFLSPVLCGAAVYVEAKNGIGLPVFEHCRFLDNYATSRGGAYYVSAAGTKGSTPVFRYCEFRNNRVALRGGAIYMSGGNAYDRGIEFDHCIFTKNQAEDMTAQGGVLYFQQNFGNEEINFQNCNMDENTSEHIGGVLSIWFSGIEQVSFFFDSCSINDNYAKREGIFYITQSLGLEVPEFNFTMQNSIFNSNRSSLGLILLDAIFYSITNKLIFNKNTVTKNENSGYLIGSDYASITNNVFSENDLSRIVFSNYVTNNLFYKNKSTCIASIGSQTDSANIGIRNNLFIQNGDTSNLSNTPVIRTASSLVNLPSPPFIPFFTNNLFYQNTYSSDDNFSKDTTLNLLKLRNNIFIENINTANGAVGIPIGLKYDSLQLEHNLLDLACTQLPHRAWCGPGNILSADPQFVDPASGDFHLQPCSPAIDAGSDAAALLAGILEDFDGNPRILDQAVDIGPFESPMLAPAQNPAVEPACAGQPEGTVQFDLQNGCLPFDYSWDNGAQTGDNLSQLAAGTYHFTITDQKGKSYETTVEVPGAEPLDATASILDASGPLAADGSINVSILAGTAPFIYQWNTGDTTANLENVAPGTYTLTVTDAAGCAYYFEYEVKFTSNTGQAFQGKVQLYPNPASDFLQIEVSDTSLLPWNLKLTDARGQLVLHQNWNGAPLDVSGLPNGLYFLELGHTAAGIFREKVLVLH